MFSVSPEIYEVLSVASRWLFAFFALILLLLAFSWHHSDRKERKDRFRNLPGAGTIGELVVLSGSRELPQDTWFPVPREGVLGSLRSCDLVIPCPGVVSHHLDFSWQDGTGLLIRPRIGCEVLVDGVPVSRRGAFADAPLRHGSILQVGTAMLRLQLFSALADTNRAFIPAQPVQGQAGTFMPAPPVPGAWPSAPAPGTYPAAPEPGSYPMAPVPGSYPAAPEPGTYPVVPEPGSYQETPEPGSYQTAPEPGSDPIVPDSGFDSAVPEQPNQRPAAPRRRRVDRWKEDWSE